jgi:hypothetical protein
MIEREFGAPALMVGLRRPVGSPLYDKRVTEMAVLYSPRHSSM